MGTKSYKTRYLDTKIDLCEALDHLKNFLDVNDGECRLDHHGNCQTHYINNPCLVAQARKFVESFNLASGSKK